MGRMRNKHQSDPILLAAAARGWTLPGTPQREEIDKFIEELERARKIAAYDRCWRKIQASRRRRNERL
jgi:hypothetical protein